jgi:hypothetical protein
MHRSDDEYIVTVDVENGVYEAIEIALVEAVKEYAIVRGIDTPPRIRMSSMEQRG